MKPLQDFLRVRSIRTTGNKEELAALVYACHIMNISHQPSAEDNRRRKKLSSEYAELLVVTGLLVNFYYTGVA